MPLWAEVAAYVLIIGGLIFGVLILMLLSIHAPGREPQTTIVTIACIALLGILWWLGGGPGHPRCSC